MKDAGEEITDPRLKRIAAAQVCPIRPSSRPQSRPLSDVYLGPYLISICTSPPPRSVLSMCAPL